jgi:lactate 2-monooxygenase
MPAYQYGDFQDEIYINGVNGIVPRYPFDYGTLERAGSENLPWWVLSYVKSGLAMSKLSAPT